MLSHSACIRRGLVGLIRASRLKPVSCQLRFVSSKSRKEGQKQLTEFLENKDVDENGYFVRKPIYEQKDFENSAYAQYMKRLDKEKLRLVEEKLQALAEVSGKPVADLRKKLDQKVANKIESQKQDTEKVEKTLAEFNRQLSLPSANGLDFVKEVFHSLSTYPGEVTSSPVYRYLKKLDPEFADLAAKTATKSELTNEDATKLYKYVEKDTPIGEITSDEILKVVELVRSGDLGEESAVQTQSTKKSPETASHVLETLFNNINGAKTLEDAAMYKLVKRVDAKFAELLASYSKVDAADEEQLKQLYDKITSYVEDIKSPLRKALADKKSEARAEFEQIANSPSPIALDDIFQCLSHYGDYFACSVFQQLEAIDPAFTKLLRELESAEDEASAEKKSDEIDKYIVDGSKAISQAMNDLKSEQYKQLRESIDSEAAEASKMMSASDLVKKLIKKGIDSAEFDVVSRIDPEFADAIKPLVAEDTKAGDGDALELAKKVGSMASNPESAIYQALHERDSANHAVLSQTFEAPAESDETAVQVKDTDLERLKAEDQTKLSEQVAGINKAYDMTIEAMDEMTRDLQQNKFEPIGHKVSDEVSKMLGFEPSEEQSAEVAALKGKPLPQHRDEVLDLCVNLIMKGGKKDQARKYLNRALYIIYLKTRTDPVQLLKKALDTAAPLVITKTVKTGFAKNYIVPVPLSARQRNRMAFLWILDSSDSRASNDFAVRLAEEILNVYNGNSRILEKRVLSHKLAIANRSYLRI